MLMEFFLTVISFSSASLVVWSSLCRCSASSSWERFQKNLIWFLSLAIWSCKYFIIGSLSAVLIPSEDTIPSPRVASLSSQSLSPGKTKMMRNQKLNQLWRGDKSRKSHNVITSSTSLCAGSSLHNSIFGLWCRLVSRVWATWRFSYFFCAILAKKRFRLTDLAYLWERNNFLKKTKWHLIRGVLVPDGIFQVPEQMFSIIHFR